MNADLLLETCSSLKLCFQYVFSQFRLSNFCGSAFQFTDSFLYSILPPGPSSEFFALVIVLVSILSFFVLSISLLMLSIFFFNYFNKYVHSCLLRHFCHC